MALKIGELYAELGVKDQGFSKGMAEAEKATTSTGQAASKVVEQLNKAETGMAQAAASVKTYEASLAAAEAQLSIMASALNDEVAALDEMETAANAAAIEMAKMETTLEKMASVYGENSAQVHMMRQEYNDAITNADQLNEAVGKQEQKVAKSQAAFKKAEAAVVNYRNKIAQTQGKIEAFTGQIEQLNEELAGGYTMSAVEDTTALAEVFETTDASASVLNKTLASFTTKTLSGASERLGSMATSMLGLSNASATGAIATKAISTGLRMLTSSLSATTLGFGALAVAAGVGLSKLIQWGDTLTQTYQTQVAMNSAVETWSENVTTAFEKSSGMSGFGLSGSDFVINPTVSDTWLDDMVKVWTDGKGETDAIVKEWSGSFVTGTDDVRNGIKNLQTSIKSNGFGSSFLGDMDTDIERLDEIDKSVSDLLQKRQNGFLTDEEIASLESMMAERKAIAIKYDLVPDDADPFENIQTQVESALSRGADKTTVWEDAWTAATQGLESYNAALNAEYDAQYANLKMLGASEDEVKALQEWYNGKLDEGVRNYEKTVAEAAEQTGAFAEGGKYEKTAKALEKIHEAIATGDEATIAENLANLDEAQVVEMTAALATMQAAAEQSGTELDSNLQNMLDTLESLKEYSKGDLLEQAYGSEFAEGYKNMFGENLDNEVLEIFATINADSLTDSYSAWANGQHEPLLPEIEIEDGDIPVELMGYVEDAEVSSNVKLETELKGVITSMDISEAATVKEVEVEGKVFLRYYDKDGKELGEERKDIGWNIDKAGTGFEYKALEMTPPDIEWNDDELETAVNSLMDEVRYAIEQTHYGNADIQTPEEAKLLLDKYIKGLYDTWGDSDITEMDKSKIDQIKENMYSWIDGVYSGEIPFDASDAEPAATAVEQGTAQAMSGADMSTASDNLVEQMKLAAVSGDWEGVGSEVGGQTADGIGSATGEAASAGSNLVNGFTNAILAKKAAAESAAREVAKAAAAAMKVALDEHSPSKLTAKFGAYFTEGFARGIASETRTASSAASRVANAAVSAVSVNPGAAAQNTMRSAMQSAASVSAVIDYDRLAAATANHPVSLIANGKRIAQVLGDDNATAYNNKQRRIALGYGR